MNKDVQGLIYGASIVSIITAIYMYATGKKDTGIFIGLWAPTFFALSTRLDRFAGTKVAVV